MDTRIYWSDDEHTTAGHQDDTSVDTPSQNTQENRHPFGADEECF
jgi:hypothetical protein